MINQNRVYAREITLRKILILFYKKMWIFMLSGILLGVVFIIGSKLFIEPVYVSTTKIYMLNKTEEDISDSDIAVSVALTKDYARIIQSRAVTERVIAELNLELTHEEFVKKINIVSTSPNTRILYIMVSDNNPYMASIIADTLRDIASQRIESIMGVSIVNVVEKANVPVARTSPSLKKNGMIGAIIGGGIAAIITLIWYMLNDFIYTPQDVEHYLEVSVLGVIPLFEGNKKNKQLSDQDKI